MSGLCGIGLGEYFFLQFMRTLNKSHLQEQISNAEVAVHAGDHEGRAEVPFDAVHVHLFFGGYFLLNFYLLFFFTFTSNLGVSLDTMSKLPMPAARIRAVNPYLLARFTWVQGFDYDDNDEGALP